MTFAQALCLAQRNAIACENAREKACKCHCGGRYHGKAHDANDALTWAVENCTQKEMFVAEAARDASRP